MKTAIRRIKEPARIVADITRPSDGKRVFYVTSQSQPGKLYRVAVMRNRLACGCPASVYTGNCAHRKVCHEKLEAEYAEKHEKEHTRDVVTICIPAPSVSAASHPGDTAIVRRSQQPFSLLK